MATNKQVVRTNAVQNEPVVRTNALPAPPVVRTITAEAGGKRDKRIDYRVNEPFKQAITDRAKAAGFKSTSAYLDELIERDLNG